MKKGDTVFDIKTFRKGVVTEVISSKEAKVEFPTGVEIVATANLIVTLVKIFNELLPTLEAIGRRIGGWFRKKK